MKVICSVWFILLAVSLANIVTKCGPSAKLLTLYNTCHVPEKFTAVVLKFVPEALSKLNNADEIDELVSLRVKLKETL